LEQNFFNADLGHYPVLYIVQSKVVIMRLNSDNMIRTQVSLPADDYELVKQQARSLGISAAEVIRRAVRDALPHAKGGAWMRFAGFVESGNPQSSQSLDEIVYGEKD
jgi:hypothetical protein